MMDGAYNPFVSCNLIKDKFEKMKKKKKKKEKKKGRISFRAAYS